MKESRPIGIYAFCRLLLRPGVLIPSCFVFIIGAWPWFAGDHVGVALTSLFNGAASDAALRALWRDTILVPWILGVSASAVALRTSVLPFARMLPDMRTLVARGATVIGGVCAVAFGLLTGWGATPTSGIVAFSLAILAFGSGHLLPRETGRATAGLYRARIVGLIVLIVEPGILIWAMETFPILVAFNAAWVSVLLLVRAWRPLPSVTGTSARARQHADLSHEERLAWMRSNWFFWPATRLASPSTVERWWNGSLSHGSTLDWLRAAAYERLGGRSPRWLLWQLVGGIIFAAIVAGSRNVSFLAWLLPMTLSAGEPPLGSKLTYPISRAERARVRFWATLTTNARHCLGFAAAFGVVWGLLAELHSRFGIVHHPSVSLPVILIYLVSGFAFAAAWQLPWGDPQWLPMPRPADKRPRNVFLAACARIVIVLIPAIEFSDWVVDRTIPNAVLITAAVALALYGLLWLGLRRQLARQDLA